MGDVKVEQMGMGILGERALTKLELYGLEARRWVQERSNVELEITKKIIECELAYREKGVRN